MTTEDISVLAGEYALGLLSEEDARMVESRLASDPELRAEVETWQASLSDLFDVAETPPPARVGEALRRRFAPIPPRETAPRPRWLTGWAKADVAILVTKAILLLGIAALIWSLV